MNGACTSLYPSTKTGEKAHRYHDPYYGCLCNSDAHTKDPNVCKFICKSQGYYLGDCVCKDHNFACADCGHKVCKFRGAAYCLKGGVPSYCDRGKLNYGGYDFWDTCSCVHGRLVNGECRCNDDAWGTFCQYRTSAPPPTAIERNDTRNQIDLSLEFKIFFPCALVIVIVSGIVWYWQDRRRKRAILMATRWAMAGPPRPTDSMTSFSTTSMDSFGNEPAPRPTPDFNYARTPHSVESPSSFVPSRCRRSVYPVISRPPSEMRESEIGLKEPLKEEEGELQEYHEVMNL